MIKNEVTSWGVNLLITPREKRRGNLESVKEGPFLSVGEIKYILIDIILQIFNLKQE